MRALIVLLLLGSNFATIEVFATDKHQKCSPENMEKLVNYTSSFASGLIMENIETTRLFDEPEFSKSNLAELNKRYFDLKKQYSEKEHSLEQLNVFMTKHPECISKDFMKGSPYVTHSTKIKSIPELKNELKSADDENKKFNILVLITKSFSSQALNQKNANEAQTFAKNLLISSEIYKKSWNYGNAIHYANIVLGRVAVLNGDIASAKKFLFLSGNIEGSPQLNSFGPNMTLAQELLTKGEKDSVLNYFDACLNFWKMWNAKPTILKWKAAVNKGDPPDFEGYL